MLNYLILVTRQLMIMAIIVAFGLAWMKKTFPDKAKHFMWISVAAGIAGAAVMAIMKTYTNTVNAGIWNVRIFAVSLGAFILFIVFAFIKKFKKAYFLSMIMLGIMIFCQEIDRKSVV